MDQTIKSSVTKTIRQGRRRSYNARTQWELTVLSLPVLVLVLLFNYVPMFGIILAFKNYRFDLGILGSEWVGLKNFAFFFTSNQAWVITRNTLGYNLMFIISVLAASVLFAILLNEVRQRFLLKWYQTAMFFPYYLSWVVVGFIFYAFLENDMGLINSFLKSIGQKPVAWYTETKYWPYILLLSNIWKQAGYSTLIYYAGIIAIDKEYYEAAAIDGATKLQIIRRIVLPLLSPLIIIMVLLQIGRIFYADFGMFYFVPRDIGLLYNVTEVIDTYVFRSLRFTGDIGLSAAAGLYQSLVGFVLILLANGLVKRYSKDNALF
ncbi:ABC transporter permease [Paenibacillus hamazuiensis]|uniref:ABC transporter permease n=1 Tax=Paenibacillus hamazuiensis TaxID=2936508 RepID=UPI00200DF396|nr:ABC transporter permease subunit [Paenibacillus hamazuiensis]